MYIKLVIDYILEFYGIFPEEINYSKKSIAFFCQKFNMIGIFWGQKREIEIGLYSNLFAHPGRCLLLPP